MDEDHFQAEIAQLQKELSQTRHINSRLVEKMDEEQAKTKAGNNANFIQLYKNQAKELRRLGEKNTTSLNLLLLFGEKMNKQNAIMISFKALEEITGKSRPTLARAVKVLVNELFVKIVKIGTSNAYLVNSDIFWTTNAHSKMRTSVFSATVIATEADQEPGYIENWEKVKLKSVPMIEQSELAFEHDAT